MDQNPGARNTARPDDVVMSLTRLVSIFLVMTLAIVGVFASGRPAIAATGDAFLDDNGSVHEPDINAVAAAGITTGCGPSLYCPNQSVTRAEMATFLARALKLTPQSTGPFNDISGGSHAANINAIASAGLTRGCSSTSFCPSRAVTREEMASFLARAMKLSPRSGTPFSDVTGGAHAADIAAIAAAGITTGCGGSRYCPYSFVTRAQMATFLAGALGLEKIFPVATGSIQLRPGDNVASIVSGAAPGASFWFTAGTYTGLQIVPKANQVFLGASGAVLAGNGKAFAFRSSAASVTIKGLTLEGYRPASKNGVIDGADGARDWTVSNNVIRNNGEVGIRIGNGWKVIGNNIHHNGRYGIMGSGTNVVIENNEIAYNANEYGASGDSSGTKFVHTVNLVLRGNYAHHNSGNGLWVDINNLNAVIENNRSIANSRNGIFLEISCGGIIRNNYLEGNGTDEQYPNWMGNATGIQVSMTPDVQVYGNTLVNNAKGIGAIHWDHANVGNVTKCEPELRNLRVYNNSITQNGGAAAGIDAGIEQSQVYGTWDNQFYSNTYSLSGGASYRYEGNWINQQQWTSEGLG